MMVAPWSKVRPRNLIVIEFSVVLEPECSSPPSQKPSIPISVHFTSSQPIQDSFWFYLCIYHGLPCALFSLRFSKQKLFFCNIFAIYLTTLSHLHRFLHRRSGPLWVNREAVGTVTALVWWNWGKTWEMLVRMAGFRAENRTFSDGVLATQLGSQCACMRVTEISLSVRWTCAQSA